MGFLPFRQQALYAFEGFTLADGHARILRPRKAILRIARTRVLRLRKAILRIARTRFLRLRKAILRIARTRFLRLRSASTRSQGHIRAVAPRGL